MSLIQLIYVSSATKEMSENELASILKSSAKNNEEREITGMLLYGQGRFIQVLEGESIEVEVLMSRINADPRHSFITIIERNVI